MTMRASRVGTIRDRFFQRFIVDPVSDCWNWTGTITRLGRKRTKYGVISGLMDGADATSKSQRLLAHRASWLIHRGDIPVSTGAHGTVVRHKCDNPLCVNPDHLELGTQADNVKDMLERGRENHVGITPRRGVEHQRAVLTADLVAEIISSTETKFEIAARLGIKVATVKNVRTGRTYSSITTPEQRKAAAEAIHNRERSGLKSRTAKLTREQVLYIRASSKTTYEIAEEFGVSQPTIASARRRATYTDIP